MAIMDDNQLRELIEKYNAGSISQAEKAALELWYIKQGVESEHHLSDTATDALSAQLAAALPLAKGHQQSTRLLWPRIAAAAVLLFFVAVTLWVAHLSNDSDTEMDLAQYEYVAPGKTGATLTLANGQQIHLGNQGAGRLADESGVSIIKTADGDIVYRIEELSGAATGRMNTLATSNGEEMQIRLPDGTRVYLNAGSTLRYPASFAGMERRAVNLDGEAYFEVTPNKTQPFIVETQQQEIQVLGTHFNVEAFSDEPEAKTTLVEGSVRVAISLRQLAEGSMRLSSGRGVTVDASKDLMLLPGEQGISSHGTLQKQAVNIEQVVSWKNGYFLFEDESISSIMRKLGKWYDVQVQYEGLLPTDGFNGMISRDKPIGQVLEMLEETGAVRFRVKDRTVYVGR